MCYPSPFSVPKECLLLWREQRAQGQGGMYRGVTEHTHTHAATATKITSKGASNLSEHPSSQRTEFPMMPCAPRQEGEASCQDGVWRPLLLLHLIWFPSLGWGPGVEDWADLETVTHIHTHSFTHKQHTPQQRGLPDLMSGRELRPIAPKCVGRALQEPCLSVHPSPMIPMSKVPPIGAGKVSMGIHMTDSFSQVSASPAGPGQPLRRGFPSSLGTGSTARGISLFTWISSGTELRFSVRST